MARSALSVILADELNRIRRDMKPTVIPGHDLVKIANAIGSADTASYQYLGLTGDLPRLLLRFGHSPPLLIKALTCCPMRMDLLTSASPDWIVDIVGDHAELSEYGDHVEPRYSILSTALEVGMHLQRVSPDWLKARVPDRSLFHLLRNGGHLPRVSAQWIIYNFVFEEDKVAAIIDGGHLDKVSVEWIFNNIRDRRVALRAIAYKTPLTSVPGVVLRTHIGSFSDIIHAFDHMIVGSDSMRWLINTYDTCYRREGVPAMDLANELYRMNLQRYPAFFDVKQFLSAMRQVPLDLVAAIIRTSQSVYGVDDLMNERYVPMVPRQASMHKYLRELGWQEHDLASEAAVEVCNSLIEWFAWAPTTSS